MVEFSVLGPLVLRLGGEQQTIPTAMLRRTLALLLARAETPVSADAIIDELWHGRPPQSARRTLSVYVSRLRQLLGDDDRVRWHAGAYSIHPNAGELDSHVFERLIDDAHTHDDPGTRGEIIRQALALWRGPAYDGLRDVDLIAVEADRLEQLRMAAFEESVELDLDAGRHQTVIGPLAQMIVEHPYRELLHERYMLALYRGGRQAEALEAYREIYQRMADDLGVEPGARLQQMHQRMLAGDPGLDAPPNPAADTTRPEPAVRPNLLPRLAAHFTGRQAQLAELDRMAAVDSSTSPIAILSTITGSAGVGKSALAVHWSRGAGHRFPDGQLYINLQGYGGSEPINPYTALSHFLREMGVPAEEVPPDEQSATARYRSMLSTSATLVVLDNANSVAQVRPLLPTGARCMTLVTSRDRLSGLVALDGAHRVHVEPLQSDESLALLGSIIGPGRVAEESEAAATLVDMCGRLPLALRIAGATLVEEEWSTIAAYTARLATMNRLSTLAIDDDPESSVRHAFSHSYLRLGDDVQRMFRLLGLIPGRDIGVAAAAALAGRDEAEAVMLLDRLCSAHLLNERDPGRYVFHDLIRDYASEVGAFDETAEARDAAIDRVVRWYATQADHADHAIRPPLPMSRAWIDPTIAVPDYPDAQAANRWFDLEGPNLLELIRFLETVRPSACCSIVSGVFGWLEGQRRLSDWRETQTIGVRAAIASGDRLDEAQMRSGLGIALANAGHFEEAMPEFEQSLAIRREIDTQPRRLVSALMNMGSMLIQMDRPTESLAYLEECLALVEKHGFDNLATVLNNIGLTYQDVGRLDDALDCFQRTLALATARGDERRIITASGNLCSFYVDRGDFDKAAEHGQVALEHSIVLGQMTYQARAHVALGLVDVARGRLDSARTYLEIATDEYADNPDERALEMLRSQIAAASDAG